MPSFLSENPSAWEEKKKKISQTNDDDPHVAGLSLQSELEPPE